MSGGGVGRVWAGLGESGRGCAEIVREDVTSNYVGINGINGIISSHISFDFRVWM